MPAKGFVTGNGPADRLLESLKGRPADPWSQEEAKRLVEWKHAIRRALPKILEAERNRTIASMRGRLSVFGNGAGADVLYGATNTSLRKVLAILDEMESAPPVKEKVGGMGQP